MAVVILVVIGVVLFVVVVVAVHVVVVIVVLDPRNIPLKFQKRSFKCGQNRVSNGSVLFLLDHHGQTQVYRQTAVRSIKSFVVEKLRV